MGFGSYDESDQQRQESSADEDEGEVSPHGEGHDGESSFELDGSADEMLDQLRAIKEQQDEADE